MIDVTIDLFSLEIGEKRFNKRFLIGRLNVTKFDFDIEDFSGFGEIKGGKLAASIEAKSYSKIIWDFT